MDVCKCGKSGMDLEEGYSRIMGEWELIKKYNYNFFEELVLCFQEQGFKYHISLVEVLPGYLIPINTDFEMFRQMEDEMLQELI